MSQEIAKVGIVTIQGRYNYGNRLQNYAVEQIYSSMGFLPESLILHRKVTAGRKAKLAIKFFLGRKETARENLMSAKRLSAFDRFNERLHLRVIEGYGSSQTADYAYISAGSDQIWGLGRCSFGEDWAYLRFARAEQRVALAPSLGVDSISSRQSKRLARYVGGFDRLSVREESGARLIKEASGRDAEVICDPTLVLSATEWRALASDTLIPEGPYVLAYLLGSSDGEASEVLRTVTHDGVVPVVPLSDRERNGEPPAGPAEFISFIDNATHVVTDSFHAAVFSSILETPLTIVHRSGGEAFYSRMFGRLKNLSKSIGIEEKMYGSPAYEPSRAGDYEDVIDAISREKNKFMSYLCGCLNG